MKYFKLSETGSDNGKIYIKINVCMFSLKVTQLLFCSFHGSLDELTVWMVGMQNQIEVRAGVPSQKLKI